MKLTPFLFQFTIFCWLLTRVSTFGQQDPRVESVVQKGHFQPISALAYHPSGAYFASGGMDQSIKIWDISSGKLIRNINIHSGKIIALSFSKDGAQLLSAGMDNFAFITDVSTGEIVEKYELPVENGYPMTCVFTHDDQWITVGTNRDLQLLIHRNENKITKLTKGFSAITHGLSVNPYQPKLVHLHNYNTVFLITPETKDTITLEFDKPYNYSFSPDGKSLLIGSTKLFASIFDVETGKLLKTIVPSEDQKCDGCNLKIAYSPDGKLIATYDKYNGLTVWKGDGSSKILDQSFNEERYDNLSFSPQGNYILLNNDNLFSLVNIATKKIQFTIKNDYLDRTPPVMNPDEKSFLLGGSLFEINNYKSSTGKLFSNYRGYLNTTNHSNLNYDYTKWTDAGILNYLKYKMPFAIAPDGSSLALGKVDTSAMVTDLKTGRTFHHLREHRQQVLSVTYSSDGKTLATGDAAGKIFLWDLSSGKLILQIKGHRDPIFDLAFNSTNQELLSGSWDGTIKHWNVTKGDLIGKIDLASSAYYKVLFSPDDLYIIAGDVEQNVKVFETDTKSLAKNLIGHSKTVSGIEYDGSSDRLITSSWDGSIRFWDFLTGTLVQKYKLPENSAALCIAKHSSLPLLFIGGNNRTIYVYDWKKKQLVSSFVAHQSGVGTLVVNEKTNTLYSRSIDGEIKVWNLTDYTEKLTYTQLDAEEWLITQPDGYFDGTGNAMKQINYVSGMKALEVGSFFKKYYYPGLYQHLLENNNPFDREDQGINRMMDVPEFDLQFINFQNQLVAAIPDSVFEHQTQNVSIDLIPHGNVKEIDRISVYNNGKLIQEASYGDEVQFRGGANKKTISVDLTPGQNTLEFRLTTKAGLTTSGKQLILHLDAEGGKTELYILSLGINEYLNKSYNLKYAKNDAHEFSETLKTSAEPLFQGVHTFELLNGDVTKENVLRTLETIKAKIGPEDVFVFYYAGHGMMYENTSSKVNDFYLIMSDITNLYGDKTMLDAKGISTYDLMDISKNISAQKQLFVLDACQSGAVLDALAMRGVSREKSLAQLAKNTGTFFLTASQDIEYANEVGDLKHGIFTYSILELLEGKSEGSLKDETITIYELKSYVESRVPELSKIHHGSSQYPTGYSFGSNFPIGVTK